MAFLKLTKLGLFLMLLGIIFQRRVVDTVKDLPPSDSRLNRGQTRFSSPCLLDLSLMSLASGVETPTSTVDVG